MIIYASRSLETQHLGKGLPANVSESIRVLSESMDVRAKFRSGMPISASEAIKLRHTLVQEDVSAGAAAIKRAMMANSDPIKASIAKLAADFSIRPTLKPFPSLR